MGSGVLGRLITRRLGFSVDEVMAGYHEFEAGFGREGRYPMSFRASWGPTDLREFLNPLSDGFARAGLHGFVTVIGLCTDAPCAGTLTFDYLKTRTLRYSFDFEVDGCKYRYVGDKVNIRLWNLLVSHTTCYGTLTELDTGRLVSRSITYFRLRLAPRLLASLRPTFTAA